MSDRPPFAIVPIEVVLDRRLTLWQTRVLIALLSFQSKNTDTVWPSRQALSDRCGLHVENITKVTGELVKLGWLKKVGDGGRSRASEYEVIVPETPAESAGDCCAETPAESASYPAETPAESAGGPPVKSAGGIEQTIEQKEKKESARSRVECPDGVTQTTWTDFLRHRRAKRAEVTQTALDGIAREAARAGWSMEAALAECCVRGWTGFKAEWVRDKTVVRDDRRAMELARLTGGIAGPAQSSGITLEMDDGFAALAAPRH